MTKYLHPNTDPHEDCFKDMEIKPQPKGDSIPCQVCKGYGGWNLALNQYKNYTNGNQHFRCMCNQCWGHGYVSGKSATCIHEMHELNQDECRVEKVSHFGNCFHVIKCIKCGEVRSYDSGD